MTHRACRLDPYSDPHASRFVVLPYCFSDYLSILVCSLILTFVFDLPPAFEPFALSALPTDIERLRATIRTHTLPPPRRRVAYLYTTPSPGFGHGHRIIAHSFLVSACACRHFKSPFNDRRPLPPLSPPPLARSPSFRDCGHASDFRPPSNSQTGGACATIRERPRCVGLQIDARTVLDYVHAHPQLVTTQIVWCFRGIC